MQWHHSLVTADFALQRFVDAQDAGGTYDTALVELRAGRKQTHWMWFVFPQLAGLGRSSMAQFYGISGLPEAVAYLAHPVLGARLVESAKAMLDLVEVDAVGVLGAVDAQKLRSSMTLFVRADSASSVFQEVLNRYFAGVPDEQTLLRLAAD